MLKRFPSRLAALLLAGCCLGGSPAQAQLEDIFGEEPSNQPTPAAPAAEKAPAADAQPSEPAAEPAAAPAQEAELVAPPEAEAAAEVPSLTLAQWARLGAGGTLRGNLSSLAGPETLAACGDTPVMLVRSGAVIGRTTTNDEGDFEFSELTPGVVTVMASSPDCLAAYSVTLAEPTAEAGSVLQVVAIADLAPERRRAMLASVIMRGASGSQPARFVAQPRETSGTYQVAMTPAGGIRGSVLAAGRAAGEVEMAGMMVRAIRNGRVVAQNSVKPDGSFELSGLGAGPVGIVIFGPAGFAATGIELVDAGARTAGLPMENTRLVAVQDGPAEGLNIEMAPLGDVAPVVMEGEDTPPAAPLPPGEPVPPAASAGVAGPGGGFGGGGGGGGMFGDVGGLAALGIAAAAIAASDDDNGTPIFIPAPVSPSGP